MQHIHHTAHHQPRCFAPCRTCSLHAHGRWVPASRAYVEPADEQILKTMDEKNRNQSGCSRHHKEALPAQEFEPSHCTLKRFDRAAACSALGSRKSLVFVGDSLTHQLFYSLALLLGGSVAAGRIQVHASLCNDQVRMLFVRSDLALWLPTLSDSYNISEHRKRGIDEKAVGRANPFLVNGQWVQRAVRDADVLVIGTGLHYGMTTWSLDRNRIARDPNSTHGPPRPDNGLVFRNLNYTLARALEARGHWGHHPASLIVLGAPVPIPACRRYTQPITLAEAFRARLEYTPESDPDFAEFLTKFPANILELWQSLFETNTILQRTASSWDASFLDVAPISMTRPDGASAQQGGGGLAYDCLHSCQPGPVDTWTRLLLALVDDNRDEIFGGDNWQSPSRFFRGRFAEECKPFCSFLNLTATRSTQFFEECSERPDCWSTEEDGLAFNSGTRFAVAKDGKTRTTSASKPCCAVKPLPDARGEPWWPFGDGPGVGVRTLAT